MSIVNVSIFPRCILRLGLWHVQSNRVGHKLPGPQTKREIVHREHTTTARTIHERTILKRGKKKKKKWLIKTRMHLQLYASALEKVPWNTTSTSYYCHPLSATFCHWKSINLGNFISRISSLRTIVEAIKMSRVRFPCHIRDYSVQYLKVLGGAWQLILTS